MSLKERIQKLMIDLPYCCDNDDTLCTEIWNQDCQKLGLELSSISAIVFLNLVGTGQLSKQQTILRTRRQLNNKKPETRGKSYKRNVKKKVIPLNSVTRTREAQQNLEDKSKHQFPRHSQHLGAFSRKSRNSHASPYPQSSHDC